MTQASPCVGVLAPYEPQLRELNFYPLSSEARRKANASVVPESGTPFSIHDVQPVWLTRATCYLVADAGIRASTALIGDGLTRHSIVVANRQL